VVLVCLFEVLFSSFQATQGGASSKLPPLGLNGTSYIHNQLIPAILAPGPVHYFIFKYFALQRTLYAREGLNLWTLPGVKPSTVYVHSFNGHETAISHLNPRPYLHPLQRYSTATLRSPTASIVNDSPPDKAHVLILVNRVWPLGKRRHWDGVHAMDGGLEVGSAAECSGRPHSH